jgi:hypothetical protein
MYSGNAEGQNPSTNANDVGDLLKMQASKIKLPFLPYIKKLGNIPSIVCR